MHVVFDLDGTLRNIDGDQFKIPKDITKACNWLEWQEWVNENGKPIKPIVNLFLTFTKSMYLSVTIKTSSQFGTQKWMRDNKIPLLFCRIEERSGDDNDDSFEYKRKYIDKLVAQNNLQLWVDDSVKVCEYVESLGIPTIRVTPEMLKV